MLAIAKRLGIVTFCVVVAVGFVLPGEIRVEASGPYGATYCSDTNKVFWFVQASDPHIGTSGSTDSNNLTWLVTTARSVIHPLFTVVTGDLTDSTNGNLFGYPNGPYRAEWTEYRNILTTAGVGTSDYFDLPGNHDAYNDRDFTYYKTYALQGGTYGLTGQVAWTEALNGIGTYHFVGVNTADNTGAPFSIFSPYGDHAGLDSAELGALTSDLAANNTANLTFVFGHHPVSSTGDSADTYLYYGAQQFVGLLDNNLAVGYQHGHVHDNVETFFTGTTYTGAIAPGFRYSRVSSLGKESPNSFTVVSVDCDGVNTATQPVGTWPVVLITAPVNRYVGTAANPFAYNVPNLATNPIRALVFDIAPITAVSYRIDGGTPQTMSRVGLTGPQWVGTWDATGLARGEHSIEVTANGTTPRSHTIKVFVDAPIVNHAPVAANDTFTASATRTLTAAAPGVLANDTDEDRNTLTPTLATPPAKGTVVLNANGGFTYTLFSGATAGTDTFSYAVSEPSLTSNVATVTVSLTSPDTVKISAASYTKKTSTLLVTATSTAAPSAVLTVAGYGGMTYNSKTKVYTLQKKVSAGPTQVVVDSSAGGTSGATTVTQK